MIHLGKMTTLLLLLTLKLEAAPLAEVNELKSKLVRENSGLVLLELTEQDIEIFSADSIEIVEDMADLTNELYYEYIMRDSSFLSQTSFETFESMLSRYPAYASHLKRPFNFTFRTGFETVESVCGEVGSPKPSYILDFEGLTPDQFGYDYEKFLEAKGFHRTIDLLGGGWTKPKTYRPDLCGWNSYRDHAYFLEAQNLLMIQEFKLQAGEPNGEPNPELDDYEWPYLTWPIYVRWWHENF